MHDIINEGLMTDEADMDQREYGELIATVRHLSGVVEGLQQQYVHDSAKLHARLDEVLRTMTPRQEHDRLQGDVSELWKYSRDTRTRVDRLDGGVEPTRWMMRWAVTAGASIVSASVGAMLYAAFL